MRTLLYNGEHLCLAKQHPLFFFVVLVLPLVLFPCVHDAASGVSSFFWLKSGTQASYTIQEGPVIFDDRAEGHPFRGNYSWLCLKVNYTHAVLDVEVTLELFKKPEWTTPAHIDYFGSEFVEKASRGDLSFIKRIPMDQVIGRIEIHDDPQNPAVLIPSPIILDQKFTVTVDLDTMMMYDEDGRILGKWILWIDPLKYPLEDWHNPTVELFVTNWLNTTIYANVFYVPSPPFNIPLNTLFGEVNRYFCASVPEPLENEFLSELGWSAIFLGYHYEPRTGILLPTDCDFIDDLLTQKLGVVGLHSFVKNGIYLSSIVFVGDLNSDWVVNISDLTIVARAFRTKPGDEKWNQTADLNKDDIINILDIAITAKAFGTQYITTD